MNISPFDEGSVDEQPGFFDSLEDIYRVKPVAQPTHTSTVTGAQAPTNTIHPTHVEDSQSFLERSVDAIQKGLSIANLFGRLNPATASVATAAEVVAV